MHTIDEHELFIFRMLKAFRCLRNSQSNDENVETLVKIVNVSISKLSES